MPLNAAGYTATGAGTAAANNSYIAITGANATLNGATQYSNGTDYLALITNPGAPYWAISAAVNQVYTGTILYSVTTGAATTNMPLTGWVVVSGAAAAPTFAGNSSPGYAAAGAGTSAANGNYAQVTGANATYSGAPQYTNGVDFLTFSGTGWGVYTAVNAPGASLYAAGGTASVMPLTGWGTTTGTAPAPTFTALSVAPAITAPNALTSVTFALADSGSTPNPTLTWVLPTSGTAYTGFNIRRGTTAGGESATPVNGSALGAGALSFIDMTAVYAGDYYYVVDGLSAGGTVTSSELHIKSMTAAPTGLAVTFGSGQAILSWTNAVGTLGVIAERTVQGANSWAAVATLTTPVTTYTDSTVVNGTAYSFRVRNTD